MSTLKQQKAVDKAVAAMRKAAEEMRALQSICIKHGVDTTQEERFSSDLRERASYWENCTWWKK